MWISPISIEIYEAEEKKLKARALFGVGDLGDIHAPSLNTIPFNGLES